MKAFAVALCMMVPAFALSAEDAATQPPRNLDPGVRAEGGALADLIAAQDLFARASARKDPLAALAAARIMAGIAVVPVARLPDEGAAPQGDAPLSDAARMFDLARALALDEALASLVEAERIGNDLAPAQRVAATSGLVGPGAQDRWTLTFYGGALAEVAIVGRGGGVLDIRVEDAGGQVVCQQAGPRDLLYCPFVPRENGRFSVLVGNPGAAPAAYALLTN